jgi:diaminopimelate decarboxylase
MVDLVKELVAKYFALSAREFVIGGVPVTKLANDYGTPLYIYDRTVLDRKLSDLRAALPTRVSVYYSMKANPNGAIVRHLLSRGCGLEIASSGELHQALQAGCLPQCILFAGPGKSEAELELAVSRGIGEIHVESLIEVQRLEEISRRMGVRTRVAIRVNPTGEAEGGAMRMGGRPAPFGVDEEVLEEVVSAIMSDRALYLQGIHLFVGTQNLDATNLTNQYRHGLEVARRVVRTIGRPLCSVDFGGGLGIPYFAHENELDLAKLRELLAELWDSVETDSCFTGTQFVIEPGRFLVGEAGVYVARVNDIKVSRGKKFLILDGGMNHHLAASGNLGQTIKRNYPLAILNRINVEAGETVDVVGPLCTPLDMLARGAVLPKAELGDLVGIFQSGAYGLTASPVNFLSHTLPAEILVAEGKVQLIRPRGQFPHTLEGMSCLPASESS